LSSGLNLEDDDRHEEDRDIALAGGASSSEIDGVPAMVGLEAI